eukprot:TRINITY_DN35771_c0_g1_i6.p1 TRINITY_DN35771_c0_g1~~TRINITY_DN35771_c0_g1_i6.p1  ORF type:complete len:435 (+),score=76.97 TRINITY_DN35771_c0_g1_i6:693-1997(+)
MWGGQSQDEATAAWVEQLRLQGYDASTIAYYQQYYASAAAAAAASAASAQSGVPFANASAIGGQSDEEDEDGKKPGKANAVPLSTDSNYNISAILAQNIRQSDYFKSLFELPTFHEVMTEISNKVTHVEPNIPGHTHIPSTAYCLLYKCFTLKLTFKQMTSMLNSKKSCFIRALGFLYLRYGCESEKLWDWFEPHLDDPAQFIPGTDGSQTTVGAFVRKLLSDRNYFSTLLPRIPVLIEREIKKKLLREEIIVSSKISAADLKNHLKVGTKVRAQYYEDAKYYDAVIDEILKNGKYRVTFSEYGNQEEVPISSIKLKESSTSAKSGSVQTIHDLDKEILRRERENASSRGRNYIKRPSSCKSNLSMQLSATTNRKRSRSRSPLRKEVLPEGPRASHRSQERSRSPPRRARHDDHDVSDKRRKLLDRYGDASSRK